MSVKQEMQLEGHLDYALKKHGFQPLQEFLQNESTDKYSQKCSRQMSVKLDKLICRELEKKNIKNVSILLTVIYKFGKFMTSNGEDWLTASIKQGLVEKMVDWFEKTKEIFACGDKGKNEALISLAEDLFDVIMIFHDHSNDGKIQILENFIMRICALISDTTFNTFVKQEAVRKLNLMLDTMPRDARKRILFTEEMMPIMSAMGKRIIDAGDYDLQVAITEALCRMTSEKQRGELARQWFPMEFVTEAFKGIKDSDFETDCRKFLNLVNGMLGNQRRVFTYPCLSAFLENYELQIPSDEKLEEFWIDFNTGTQSISFYVSTDNNGEDHQWETVCMTEDDVDKYTIEEIDNKKLLTVALKTPATVGQKEGNEIRIYFDSLLDIFEVASKVFGANKFKGFTKKQTISVAKTAVHIIFDESGSQVFIPESQESISSLKHTAVSDNEHMKRKTQPPKTTSSINECPYQGDSRSNNAKLVTPKMSKVSEASIIIPCTGGLNTKTPAKMTKTSTPRQGRVKPPLEIIHSSERSTVSTSETNNSIGKSAYKKENQQFQTGAKSASKIEKQKKTSENAESLRKADCDDQIEIVPDTQPFGRMDSPMLPGLTEKYLGKHKSDISKKQTSSTCMKEKISISTGYLCNEDNVSDRIAKQRAFYSIFEGEQSPKQARKTVQPLSNETCKITWKEKNKTNESELAKQKKSSSDERENPANIVEKTNFAKSRTALKSPDYNRTNETSKSCAQVESPAKSNKQGSGSRQGAHRRWSERLLEATHPAAASKDTEKEKKAKGLKDAAQALICKIGSKYSRDKKSGEQPSTSNNIDTYTLSKTNKDKSQSRTFNLKNKKDFTATVPDHRNDVYSFKFNGSDNPTIKLGASATSVSKQNPEKSAEKYPNREIDKEKKLQSYNQHKHLFSDTDTDKAADESKTDISWLQNPLSKEKPKVKGYSRQKPRKKQEAALQNKLKEKSNICQHEKMKSSKDTNDRKAAVENPDGDIKQSKSKRPRRAAVKSRNYKDLTDSEPESEDNNAVPSPGTVDTAKSPHAVTKGQKPMPVQRKRKKVEKPNHNQSNRNQPEIEKRVSYNHTELPSHLKSELSHVCTPDSPASIDQIRCEEYVSDTEVKATRRTIRSSSPALSASSSEKPTPENPNGISAKIFYSAAVKKGSNQWTKSTYRSICRTEKESSVHNTNGKEACSPASSPAFQTTLTSISLDHSAISGLCKEISGVEYVKQDVSEQSLNTSTDIGKHAPVSDKRKQTRTVENTMQSCQSTGRRNLSSELLHHDIHKSGPSVRTAVSTLKRIYRGHCDSDVEETHSDVKPRKAKMVPRKLFTSKDERDFTCRVSESMSTVSGNEVSTLETDTWEGSGSDVGVGVICQKISKEFTRKIQNRSRKMDYFTKQSLKSAQQHLTSVSVKVRDCRVKQLDRFQGTILEEIDNFEKDSQALKNMEKEFTSVWKQQTQAFILYQKNEQRRIQHLKSSFEKNLCLSYDYEENIFNAEIHHMKDDMKLVQEKLLKELQEEELLSVRRGLQSLFMAGTRTL